MTQKKYYRIYPKAGSNRNYHLLNKEALRAPGKKTWGVDVHNPKMPDFPVRPHILFDTKNGGLPGDVDDPWGGGDCWIISDAAKLFLEKTVPDAVEFFECETSLPNGDPALPYWFVLVIPVLEAVDEERSKVKIKYWDNGAKTYSLMGKTSLALKESVVKNSHLFRLKYAPSRIVCDEYFKAACEEAGLKFGDFDDLKKLGQS